MNKGAYIRSFSLFKFNDKTETDDVKLEERNGEKQKNTPMAMLWSEKTIGRQIHT